MSAILLVDDLRGRLLALAGAPFEPIAMIRMGTLVGDRRDELVRGGVVA